MSEAHKHRARIFLHRGDLVQARAAWEAAVEEDRSTNDLGELSNSLGNLGNACALCEDFDTAERCYREVLDLQRTEQNPHGGAFVLRRSFKACRRSFSTRQRDFEKDGRRARAAYRSHLRARRIRMA